MTARYIAQREKTALVAGLQWVPLMKEGRRLQDEIRSAANTAEASKVLVVQRNGLRAVGLFNPPDVDLEDSAREAGRKSPKPSKHFSLAAAFARFAGDGNAVLAYAIGDGGRMALVVVESGVPTLDDIKNADEARTAALRYASGVTGFNYVIYSNDAGVFGGSEPIDDADLWKHADRSTQLVPKPANVKGLVVAALVVAVGAAGLMANHNYQKEKARKAALLAAARDNPLPRYQGELASALRTMGLTPASLEQLLASVRTYPTREAGWRLEAVECFAQAAQCVSSWARDGGTTDALVAARKPAGDEMTPDSSLTRVRLVRKVEIAQGGVTSRQELPELDEQMQSTASTLQRWINAGIEYKPANEGRYGVWPVVSGLDMARVPAASTVRVLPIEVTAPMPLASDLIRSTPRNIWWSDLRVWVDDTAGDTAAVKVLLKGKSYVR